MTPPPVSSSAAIQISRGLLTPYTPSNTYFGSSTNTDRQYDAPMSPESPTIVRSSNNLILTSYLNEPIPCGSRPKPSEAAIGHLHLSRPSSPNVVLLGSGPHPQPHNSRSANSSCLFSGSSGTNATPNPLLSSLQDLDINMEPAFSEEIPRTRSKAIPVVDAIHDIINILKHSKISLSTLLQIVLDESCNEFAYSRAAFYAGRKSQFTDVLELFWNSEKGSRAMKAWLKPHAIEMVCDIIHTEMEAAKPDLQMTTAQVMTDFVSTWDINAIMEPIANNGLGRKSSRSKTSLSWRSQHHSVL